MVGLLGVTGYFFDVRALYGMSFYTLMALNTSVIFFLLSLGILFARSSHGLMDIVSSEHSGSSMLRRILPAAIVISFLLGWVHLKCEQLGLYSHEFVAALFFIIQLLVLSVVIWVTALLQNRVDIERKSVGEKLKEYRDNLEELVEERTAELKASNEKLLQEIIERKRTEENMERLRHQNELILNSAGEGILGIDLQGNHTFINPSAARMFGYELEELTGRHSHTIWHHRRPDGSPYPPEECKIYAAFRNRGIHTVWMMRCFGGRMAQVSRSDIQAPLF